MSTGGRISAYWQGRGMTLADKRVGRTFTRSDGVLGCNECCFKDRDCDTRGHFHRDSCPYCLGTGVNATPQEYPMETGFVADPDFGLVDVEAPFDE